MIGEKIKKAISKSDYTPEQVAAHAEMSVTNLYKIYKRDSIESRYLVKIAQILELPYSYFLDEDADLSQSASGSNIQQATRVGQNHQSINVGMSAADCVQKLEALQEKYALLEKVVDEKERTIKILMKE